MITRITFPSLKVEDYRRIAKKIVEVIKRRGNITGIEKLLNTIVGNILQIEQDLENEVINQQTQSIVKHDALRDRTVEALNYYCYACCFAQEEEKREAAEIIWKTLSWYRGRIESESYNLQSIKTRRLLFELENNVELREASNKIIAKNWIKAARNAQCKFEQSVVERLESKEIKPDNNTRAACASIRKTLEKLFRHLELMQELTARIEWDDIIRQMNELVQEELSSINIAQKQNAAEEMLVANKC